MVHNMDELMQMGVFKMLEGAFVPTAVDALIASQGYAECCTCARNLRSSKRAFQRKSRLLSLFLKAP